MLRWPRLRYLTRANALAMLLSVPSSGGRSRSSRLIRAACAVMSIASAIPVRGAAQSGLGIDVAHEVFAGSELEEYLRLLQTVGKVGEYPWSLRAFGAEEVFELAPPATGHPWAGRYDFSRDSLPGPHISLIRPQGQIFFNSAFPYGYNDGAVWAGKGFTTAARVGAAIRYGPLSVVLAPEIFRAENLSFDHPDPRGVGPAFTDPAFPTTIDLPQRFGDDAYARVSPGQSSIRLNVAGVTVGVSTANQQWGPAWDQPLILGNNAAGFPHLHFGTARPVNIWVGDVHARILWGALGQSDYAPAGSVSDRRFSSGMVAVFRPRGLKGLEVGGSRFFHQTWPEGGPDLGDFLWPFQSILKEGLDETGGSDNSNDDNQLASVFARWLLGPAGAELYGEYVREDHSWNLRDLALEPDHDSGFVLGFAKGWSLPAERILSLRAELLNAHVTQLDLVRNQTPLYRHTRQRQGHTHLGQILGASSGYAGGHARLAVDLYHPRGRWGAGLTRSLRRVPLTTSGEANLGRGADVMFAPEISGTYFLGTVELSGALAPVYEFNRHLEDDAFNLNLRLQVRAGM